MSGITINITERQLHKVIEAYQTIREFLSTALSPNELYRKEFLKGLSESDTDIKTGKIQEVKSFDDFIS